VLHRDIKPSNLILGDDGQVYLVDFGAVQDSAAAEGVTFTVVGTTGYAPLEQFWGRAVPASDLYALGATLIHLLTGTAPADLPQRDLRIQFRDRISLNPNFTRWVEVLTAPDLEQRFTQASEALKALLTNRYPKSFLSTIPKPLGSKVQLKKSADELLIKIPRKRRTELRHALASRSFLDFIKLGVKLLTIVFSILSSLILACFILSTIILILLILFALKFHFVSLLSLVPLLFLCIFFLLFALPASAPEVKQATFHIFGKSCIRLNKQYFFIGQQLFGFHLGNREELSAITDFYQIPFKEITIKMRLRKYSLGEELTESERDWLFQEIRDWLNNRR
jgi:serine/threonine protein kinase